MQQGKKDDSSAAFNRGVELFRSRKFVEAAAVLKDAVEAGDAEAQNLLGLMLLNGMGVPQNSQGASQLFGKAAESGLKEAQYNLANLLYNGLSVTPDPVHAQEHLLAAARAGHRAAQRTLGYLYHLASPEERWQRLSTACFHLAAEAGDPLSMYALGMRLAQGRGTPADIGAAAHWLSAAAKMRVYLAESRLRNLRTGTHTSGGSRSVHAYDVEGFPPFSLGTLPALEPLRSVSFMSEYAHALDPYLCDHLINVAAPSLLPSGVVHPETGRGMRSEARTSYSMSFVPNMYDAVVAESLRRVAAIAGLPAQHAEPVGVLRYGIGQEYRPHFDFYEDPQHTAQRVTTVFIYLNDVPEGGGTEFPRLGVTVAPERGKAVKFLNCDALGKPNPETLHAGLPVVHGEKWLVTLWFWDQPFPWFAWEPDHEPH